MENADYSRDEALEFEKELSYIIYRHIDESLVDGGRLERQDVCSMLLKAVDQESGDRLSRTEIHDELISLLKAGFATVSNSITWAFEGLLSHQHVLSRVHSELDQVLGDGPITPEALGRFSYLDATLMESLRLHPLAAFNGVRLLTSTFELDGYQIPPGTILAFCSYLLHRRPELFPEPLCFNPDRFLDQKIKPYSWLPFGGGVRLCIGKAFALQEMKIILASVLRRFRLRIVRPVTKAVWQGFFLSPEHGLLVNALPREKERVT